MFRKLALFTGIGLLTAILCGCATGTLPPSGDGSQNQPPSVQKPTVKIVVTTDFGKEVMLEQTIEIEPDTSALEALKRVATVETKYGGNFVDAINGVSSQYMGANGSKKDWLWYVNGVSSNIGANDYVLKDNDIEHWDFRDWSYQQFIPAIIGEFPQPFLNGYHGKVKPTVIVYEEWFQDCAQLLVETLSELGVGELSAVIHNQLPKASQEQYNLIVLGRQDNELILELNNLHKKLGFYTYFNGGKLVVLNTRGEVVNEYGDGSGLIQATQNPWNPKGVGAGENVVWMISGTDDEGVRKAVQALTSPSADLSHAYAAIVIERSTIKIPQ